jgi:hypothetical protein
MVECGAWPDDRRVAASYNRRVAELLNYLRGDLKEFR